jgi:hypothetical protein
MSQKVCFDFVIIFFGKVKLFFLMCAGLRQIMLEVHELSSEDAGQR